ncbi:MAG: hypothetical protein GKS01_11445 [Alphaproteobacteria bacterium]|nr:hypothetical protein [Alphaproteobacteria bacterium]
MDAISRDSKIEETFIGILKLYRLRRIVSDLIDGRSPSINVVVKENPYEKDEVDKVIEELKSILKLAKDQLKRHNSRLYFVHLPEPARFCDFFVKKTQYCYKSRALPYHENIVSAVRQMGVPVLDITSRFQREKNPARFFYHPRSHLSPTGYRFVAKAMNDAIKQSYAD